MVVRVAEELGLAPGRGRCAKRHLSYRWAMVSIACSAISWGNGIACVTSYREAVASCEACGGRAERGAFHGRSPLGGPQRRARGPPPPGPGHCAGGGTVGHDTHRRVGHGVWANDVQDLWQASLGPSSTVVGTAQNVLEGEGGGRV